MEYKTAKRFLIEITDSNMKVLYKTKITIWSKQELDRIITEFKKNFEDFVVGVNKRNCKLFLTPLGQTKSISLY